MKKDRDLTDDLFRSKLYDFEEETLPEDWEAIESRLPRPSITSTKKFRYYWAAATVAALIAVSSGLYWREQSESVELAERMDKQERGIRETQPDRQAVESKPVESGLLAQESDKTTVRYTMRPPSVSQDGTEDTYINMYETAGVVENVETDAETVIMNETEQTEETAVSENEEKAAVASVSKGSENLMADASKPSKRRRWGFGVGAGSMSAGTTGEFSGDMSMNTSTFRGAPVLMSGSSNYLAATNMNVTNVDKRHKRPLSFGVGVSYSLDDRWSLQSGLTYSYLRSEWDYDGSLREEYKQRMHFIGVPLSVSYKFAEWKRLQFYASAGGKVEVCAAGRIAMVSYSSHDGKISSVVEKQRMKEPYFSVNGKVGMSYPLIRFLSAYAEAGAYYYFDNGSKIETYHSDKPFNLGLQVGLRLGF